ncbi:MAG: dUTP diphosphatase [Planctomycetota bacterium]
MSNPLSTTLRVVRLRPEAALPEYKSALAAGLDLSACLGPGESVDVAPGEIVKVSTGLRFAIEAGFEGQVRPRSGLATKHGITVPNAPGTIDADYRGEAMVALINLGRETFTIEHGMRVAQLVIAPVAHARVLEVDALDDTERGAGGFGSTGR